MLLHSDELGRNAFDVICCVYPEKEKSLFFFFAFYFSHTPQTGFEKTNKRTPVSDYK